MPVTDLGTVGSVGSPTSISLSSTVPAGALIVVVAVEQTANGTVSDPVNGTYTVVSAGGATGFNLYYKANAGALTAQNITYTKGGAAGNAACFAALYATGGFSVLDNAVTASNSAGAATTLSTTSGTPVQAGELFIAAIMDMTVGGSGGGATNTGSWVTPPDSITGQNSGGTVAAEVIIGGDQTNAAATALTYNPNAWTNPVNARSIIVAFEIPSGAVFAQDQLVPGRRGRAPATEIAGTPFTPATRPQFADQAVLIAQRRAKLDQAVVPRLAAPATQQFADQHIAAAAKRAATTVRSAEAVAPIQPVSRVTLTGGAQTPSIVTRVRVVST